MMNEIISTEHLEYKKSSFLIDLVKHTNGKKFVEITQNIIDGNHSTTSIKLNPEVLEEIINSLSDLYIEIHGEKHTPKPSSFNQTKNKIISGYLKGISSKDLSLQTDLNIKEVEQILRNGKIKIIDQSKYKFKKWRK